MINIKKFLKENADTGYADFNKKFITTKYPILGVRIPTLKKFSKQIEPEFIELDDTLTHEDILLYGFAASNIKDEDEQLEYLGNLLPYFDNWATCDCVVGSLKQCKGEKSYNYFAQLLKNDKEFDARAAIVGFLKFFIHSDHLDDILKLLSENKSEFYYVKMAKAWFYAELCGCDFEKGYLQIKQIKDNFVKSKAISKAKESFRVSKENKTLLSKLQK